jgi:hypothetical protein
MLKITRLINAMEESDSALRELETVQWDKVPTLWAKLGCKIELGVASTISRGTENLFQLRDALIRVKVTPKLDSTRQELVNLTGAALCLDDVLDQVA